MRREEEREVGDDSTVKGVFEKGFAFGWSRVWPQMYDDGANNV